MARQLCRFEHLRLQPLLQRNKQPIEPPAPFDVCSDGADSGSAHPCRVDRHPSLSSKIENPSEHPEEKDLSKDEEGEPM